IYSADDIALFEAVAGPLAAAIENARLHRELEETTQNLERILASMQGGVIAVDADGKVTNANSAATRLLGPIATGRDFHALPTEVAWVLDSTFQRGRGVTGFETAIAGPEGDRIPVAISSALLKNAQMETAGAMVLITDLSEIKRLEQHVHRADRLSSIGTLAAGMAHEIKNPLMSIKTFMQLLPTSYEDKDFRDTMSELVPREVDRINALVGRLLDFAAPKPVKPAVHDMRAVLDHVLALLDLQLRKVNVQVERDYPETEALVRADDQQLYQIFLNLILNAVEAMSGQDQGVLSIGIKAVPRLLRRDLFSPPVETPCIQVAVRDTGCGIPEKDKEHIFTPFFTKKPSGCGLGLAVVHGMVTEMGGEIDVSSVVGAGTTFTAALPVAEPDSAIENDLLSKQEEGDGR
ncbi:MAG: hypothetical protein QG656_2434, partial [Candidatus Hydrogenedentes bacterium]|nr:hypothetical protein [Candidatus Hydrogenedentota bacterium]